MAENKQLICTLLLPALQATRNLWDLQALEYVPDQEVVKATFPGGVKVVNVRMDSGTALIRDVIKGIV